MTDPISDLLIQIKNGYMAKKEKVEVSHSKFKETLAVLLSRENYLGKIQVKADGKTRKILEINLAYQNKEPKITEITRMSKISRRMYVKKNAIPRVLGGKGIAVLSTPLGLMTDKEAKKKGSGGELICKVY